MAGVSPKLGLAHRCERLGDVYYASLSGPFSLDGARRAYRRVLDECLVAGTSAILLDCREVDGEPTTMERFEFAEYAALQNAHAAGEASPLKVVLVGNFPLIDPQRFGETVARNRGAAASVTTSLDEAAAWLGLDPAAVARVAEGR